MIDKDTCLKFGESEVPGGNYSLAERSSFEVEGEIWDLIPGEGSKFDGGRGKLVTFSCLRQEKCWWILAVQCKDGKNLRIWCAELTELAL